MKRPPKARRPTPVSRMTRQQRPAVYRTLPRASQSLRSASPSTGPVRRCRRSSRRRPPSRPTRPSPRACRCTRPGASPRPKRCYRRALAIAPAHPEALHLLGLLAHQVGRPDVALNLIEQAIGVAGDRPSYHLNHGAVFQALGRLEDAILAWRRALALRPTYPEAFNNLGVALQALGRIDEAIPCFERAIALAPAYAEAHFNLGVARQTERRPDLAIHCYQAALAARPAYPAASYNLGNALRELQRLPEAAEAYRAVLSLDPSHADAQNNLGVVLQELGERDQAIECFRRTIALQADYPHAHTNLAHLLRERGRFDEAIQEYRQALAIQPDDSQAHSGLIFVLDYDERTTPAERLAERRAWNERHAHALTCRGAAHQNDRDPDRPIRVGYVSGDFYFHSAATAFTPILFAHDPSQVDVRLLRHRRPAGRADRALRPGRADLARRHHLDRRGRRRADPRRPDRHPGRSRRALGQRPAADLRPQAGPVQVTAWGYITGTGLDAVDYLLADPVARPAREPSAGTPRPSSICRARSASRPPRTCPTSPRRRSWSAGRSRSARSTAPPS